MRDWPHSPVHRLEAADAYMVTAGTYGKERFFETPERLTLLCETLLEMAESYAWDLQAWAVLANHYHFVALAPGNPQTLRSFLQHLHSVTAKQVNLADRTPGRKVWFQYWDTHLTHQKSYLARLSYVHRNAVRHGLVREPTAYRWCSAPWFERRASPAFHRTVMSFPHDRLRIPDDF